MKKLGAMPSPLEEEVLPFSELYVDCYGVNQDVEVDQMTEAKEQEAAIPWST